MSIRPATIALVIFFALAMAVFSVFAPRFASASNMEDLMGGFSFIAILAMGEAFPILTRGIDLSVGAIVALVGMVVFDMTPDLSRAGVHHRADRARRRRARRRAQWRADRLRQAAALHRDPRDPRHLSRHRLRHLRAPARRGPDHHAHHRQMDHRARNLFRHRRHARDQQVVPDPLGAALLLPHAGRVRRAAIGSVVQQVRPLGADASAATPRPRGSPGSIPAGSPSPPTRSRAAARALPVCCWSPS